MISATMKYNEMLEKVSKESGKLDDYNEMKYDPKNIIRRKIERNFGEISTNEDFESRCLSYGKACAIGLLPAN